MMKGWCSGRLTWDVFVRNLARQLGKPSLWLPVDTCKEGQKGALAAVCIPTLKSASKKHQKFCFYALFSLFLGFFAWVAFSRVSLSLSALALLVKTPFLSSFFSYLIASWCARKRSPVLPPRSTTRPFINGPLTIS